MKYRKAILDDLDQLANLFDAYRVFYRQKSAIDSAKEFLRDRLIQQDSTIFVCTYESDQKIVGFVQLYPRFSSTYLKRLWLLNDLYVDPNYRSKGISKGLIDCGKKLAVDTLSFGLTLETEKSNVIGNNLYPSAGFILDNEHNYYYWKQ